MTSQEVRALIDAKIKGQGTNVDAGSVLPAILNGILDLIDSGGGGGTSDAVQYIPQILTSPQQMQARKNQGLYYEEEEIKTVTNPETNTWPYPSDASIDYQYKTYNRVSDDTPTRDDIISLIYKSDGTAQSPVSYSFVFNVAATNTKPAYTVYQYTISAGNNVNFLVVSETQVVGGYTYNKGIYLPSELSGAYVYQVNYKATTIHQIPAKYIPQTIPVVKIEIPSVGDDVYYNMGMLNVNQYVPSRDVKFSVEGRTVQYVFVADVINGGGNSQEGDTYTFTSGGLYWVQLELNYEYGLIPYVCAMVYVESGE